MVNCKFVIIIPGDSELYEYEYMKIICELRINKGNNKYKETLISLSLLARVSYRDMLCCANFGIC